MSKIQTIQPNHFGDPKNRNVNRQVIPPMTRKNYTNPNFEGILEQYPKEAQEILGKVRHNPGFIRDKINKLSIFLNDHAGEVQTQAINAVFTTTFAPLFIAFNPFADQDKKTKEYTALRQPISAAIAIGCSMPMTMAFNNYLARVANRGGIPTYDLRIAPEKSILEKEYKAKRIAAEKNGTIEAFIEKCAPDMDVNETKFDKNRKMTAGFNKACKEGYVKNVHNERRKLFAKVIATDPKNIKINDGIINIDGEEGLPKEKIAGLTTQEELDKFVAKNNLHKKTFAQFMEEEFKVEFYKDANGKNIGFKPYIIDKKLNEIKAVDFLDRLGLFDDKLEAEELSRALAEDYQEEHVIPALKKGLKPGSFTEGGEKEIATAIGKDGSRNIQRIGGENIIKHKNMTLNQLFTQINLKTDKGINMEALDKLMNSSMSEALKEFATEHLNKIKLKENNLLKDKTVDKFAENIIRNKAAKVGSHFGSFKKYAGIVVNLPITVISCTILNWAYPRIVETLFPSLVKDDTKKGGNK